MQNGHPDHVRREMARRAAFHILEVMREEGIRQFVTNTLLEEAAHMVSDRTNGHGKTQGLHECSSSKNEEFLRAAVGNRVEAVREFLRDPEVDPSYKDNYAIIWAAYYDCVEVVRLLLKDERVNPSASGNYALRMVSGKSHLSPNALEIMKLLLMSDKLRPSDMGSDIVCAVAKHGSLQAMQLLLSDDRFHPNDHNCEARKWAEMLGRFAMADLLREYSSR
jgi:hypothetical protein